MNKIVVVALVSTVLLSCNKFDVSKNPNGGDGFLENVEVSDDFSWSTTNDIRTEITFSEAQRSLVGKVEVLDKNYNPIVAWNKIAGETSANIKTIAADFNDTLYLYSRDLKINEAFLPTAKSIDLTTGSAIKSMPKAIALGFKSADDCASAECDITISNNENNLTIDKETTACVTGNISGNLTLNKDSKITICGNATLSNINTNGGGDFVIIISESGTLTMNSLNINNKVTVINNGVLNVSGSINVNETFTNNGTVNTSGFNVNGSAKVINSGTINNSNSLNVNNDFDNFGKLNIAGNMAINGGAVFYNGCQLNVSGNLHVNGDLTNQAFVKVTGRTTFNGGSNSSLNNESIIVTRDLTVNSQKLQSDGTGVIKVSGDTQINNNSKTTQGFIDICDDNGIETNNSDDATSNFVYCETTVTTSECITEGLEISGSGSTGGSAGNLEVFYPSTGSAYRAFEDLWPSKGDYDFNDLLVKYNLTYNANSDNNLEEIKLKLQVKAIGGSLRNGIAMQLLNADLQRYNGNVFSSVSGGKTASLSSSNSTIIISSSITDELPNYYSNTGSGVSSNELYEIELAIAVNPASGVKINDLVSDIFIFRSNQPGLEIHMPGNPPSPAADQSLFNTFEDKSLTKGSYKTNENFPWAIEVSGSNVFGQPKEKVNVSEAYPEFNSWVGSQGKESKEWFKKPMIDKIF